MTSNYTIEWNEMIGRIFHTISYDYIDKISLDLPSPVCTNYR